MNEKEVFDSGLTILDGGMGTLLQKRGLTAGEAPEDWNVDRPNDVIEIHTAYVKAGSQIIYANTFGVNSLKYHGKHSLEKVISSAVENGRKAGACKVALDLGPTGRLLKPAGDLEFEEAVDSFSKTVRCGVKAGVDLVAIETMSDMRELKAAVIAVRETCELPVIATVSIGRDGKLLTGGSIEAVATLLESLQVDAYGFNCGLGPEQMLPFVKQLAKWTRKPLIVKPNAGLPQIIDGRTVYSIGPDVFAESVERLVAAGATIVGGCCGTTPEHISALTSRLVSNVTETLNGHLEKTTRISSGTDAVTLRPHAGLIIGERINPTGKKLLKAAYEKGDTAYVLREAVKQADCGAAVLDVNCGVPGMDEASLLAATVEGVQGVVTCPLQLDTADVRALRRAIRLVNGKPLVNSVNGKRESMDAVFPLIRKYGGAIVALCLDENGIPPTSEGRLAVARKIIGEGAKYGLEKTDFVFDALTLAVSADAHAACVTLETVKRLTEELGVNTVLGVSNVSFGLPDRITLNNTMYALAKRAGLSAAIANPSTIRDEIDPDAEAVLLARDLNCTSWIARSARAASLSAPANASANNETSSLAASIQRGLKNDAKDAAASEVASGKSPMEVIQSCIIPALEKVGREFERGTLYLPQLLMAADAAGEAFAVVREAFGRPSSVCGRNPTSRPVILATVKGDIHDIGKNIVRALLENYGFDVIDLGRDVAPEQIVETARRTGACLVGLSALMTTTVGAMAETVRQLKSARLDCRTVVGGAVVTEEYAASIGADYYAKDAMRTIRIAETLR